MTRCRRAESSGSLPALPRDRRYIVLLISKLGTLRPAHPRIGTHMLPQLEPASRSYGKKRKIGSARCRKIFGFFGVTRPTAFNILIQRRLRECGRRRFFDAAAMSGTVAESGDGLRRRTPPLSGSAGASPSLFEGFPHHDIARGEGRRAFVKRRDVALRAGAADDDRRPVAVSAAGEH